MKFGCNICGNTKNIYKVKFVSVNMKLVCRDAICCDEYMEQIITDEYKGIPEIKRNDSAMNNGNKLWNEFKYNNVEK